MTKPKVFVGLSGGVDSSVAAALLVEAGYQVTGVYMKNWSQDLPGAPCPWAEDLADAKRIAVKLGIDFKVYDFEREYRQKVVDYMLNEYQAGRTPNPDVMCNQEVKFKLFLETALADGADLIATGHYARVENQHTNSWLAPSEARLCQAKDQTKDQTYFLYRASQKALAQTLFPLGDLTKAEVRKLASERGFATATKPDSVGICFVGQVGIEEFLGQYLETKPGKIIDLATGEQLGWHKGAIFYTIGQRHGLDLGGGLPYYVVKKDVKTNQIWVSKNLNQAELWTDQLELADIFWINDAPKLGETYQLRTRHLAPLVEAKLTDLTSNNARLQLTSRQRAVASGQSAVIYDGQYCLGGGVIA